MASRSSQMPATGAYSWSAGSTATVWMRGGAPGSSPVSGCPWPRLHQSGLAGSKPRFWASVVTKMTPVRGTVRNACGALSLLDMEAPSLHPGDTGRQQAVADTRVTRSDDAGPSGGRGNPMSDTFDRRTILQSIVVLGAASVLPGCGSDNNNG